ncbi:hypothetical protein AB0J79_18630 [Rhodococcus coprophilus]|uniref:hypothetical protein n=1 Tax=Rhodococcus coprophilus TaxID=38310 RepID=UPI0034200390
MRAGVRRNTKQSASNPEALAALLPDELRSLEGLYTPSDYQALRGNVVDWLSSARHGTGLATPVMNAAGLSAADFYRHALAMPTQPSILRAGQKQAGAPHYESETR